MHRRAATSRRQRGGDERRVLRGPDVADLAVAEAPEVMEVHLHVPAGGGDREGVADERVNVPVVVARDADELELGDRAGLGDPREEARDLGLAVPGAVPGR